MHLIGRPFATFLTCLTTLGVVPYMFAETPPGALAVSQEESNVAAVPPLPAPQPSYSQPYTNTLPTSDSKQAVAQGSDKIAHLRRAAQHLTAAGRPGLARRVIKEALLEEKLEQILVVLEMVV